MSVMSRFIVATFVLLLSLGLSAQSQMAPGLVAELDKMPSGESPSQCGKYFTYVSLSRGGVVSFTFHTLVAGGSTFFSKTLSSDKLEIHIVDDQTTPTIKVVRQAGPVPWIEISVSPQDFKDSPCLLHSKVVRSKVR
jgi:hypothetical protein